MRFAFIEAQRSHFELRILCRVLGVSRSGYYRWRGGGSGDRQRYRRETLAQVRTVFERSRRTYGSPRIQRELQSQGRRHSRRFIGLLMRQAGLRARAGSRRRPRSGPPARHTQISNVLQRRFSVARPNRIWAADLTYIPTAQGWLYLAVVIDLASRRVVGWSMGGSPEAELAVRALRMALEQRRPGPGLLHHSDRGMQYSSTRYLQELDRHAIQPSLSRLGDCWDNAVVESFFRTLKVERVHAQKLYPDRTAAKRDLFDYIEVWYNRQRRHSTIGYLSPADYEDRL